MRGATCLFATWSLFVASGCVSGRVPMVGEPAPGARNAESERSYQDLLEAFTRRAGIYDVFDTRLFVQATLQSPSFAEARARRKAEFQGLPKSAVEAAVTAEAERLAGVTEFFMGIHANDIRHDDFARPDSIWKLTLVAGEVETHPVEIVRVGRGTLDLRGLYPYVDTFWVGYT